MLGVHRLEGFSIFQSFRAIIDVVILYAKQQWLLEEKGERGVPTSFAGPLRKRKSIAMSTR